jgi:hypothetical protein
MQKTVLILFLSLMLLAACKPVSTQTPSMPAQVATAAPSKEALATLTLVATTVPTATQLPPRVVLVAPADADGQLAAGFRAVLAELAPGSGLSFNEQASMAASDLDPSIKVVVVLPPFAGLGDLVSKAPQTQFAAVGIPGLPAAANLTLIGDAGFYPNRQAFLAGYIAAIITDDWRAGVLTSDSPEGKLVADAFSNGVRYWCGLCRPYFPPFFSYPQTAQAAEPVDKAGWQAAADLLIENGVQTVYVDPRLASPEVLQYLADAKLELIGGAMPPDLVLPLWVATVRFDPLQALRGLWGDLVVGKGGQSVSPPLLVVDTQAGFLNTARMRLVQETMDNLTNGIINPDPVPEP